MRALTGYPLWFGLISAGIKLIENRPRRILRREDYGKPLALHHGRPMARKAYGLTKIDISRIAPELTAGIRDADPPTWPEWYRLTKVTSAIVSVTSVVRCVVPQEDGEVRDADTGDVVDLGEQRRWLFGPYGYVFAPPVRLTEPIADVGGYQGCWTMAPQLEAETMRRLPGAA